MVVGANLLLISAAHIILQGVADGTLAFGRSTFLKLGGIVALLVVLAAGSRAISYFNDKQVDAIQINVGTLNRKMTYIEAPVWYTDPQEVRLGTAAMVLGKYLQLALVPYPMAYYYGYAEVVPTSVYAVRPVFYLTLYALLGILSLALIRRSPLISFGIVLYLVGLAPFSTIAEPVAGMVGDRYLFIPSLGLALALIGVLQFLGVAISDVKNNRINLVPKNLRYGLFALLLLYSINTIARNRDWQDMLTLCAADIHAVDNSAHAHNLYGYHLAIRSNTVLPPEQYKLRRQAIVHFQRALQIYPRLLNAQFDLARMYEMVGQPDSAMSAYSRTLALDTNFSPAALRIGVIKDTKGDIAGAIPYYEYALVRTPNDMAIYNSLSFALYRLKDYNSSLAILRVAHDRFPQNAEPAINIAKTFTNIFMKDSAITYLEKALDRRPNDRKIVESLIMLSNETRQTDREDFYKKRLSTLPR